MSSWAAEREPKEKRDETEGERSRSTITAGTTWTDVAADFVRALAERVVEVSYRNRSSVEVWALSVEVWAFSVSGKGTHWGKHWAGDAICCKEEKDMKRPEGVG